MTTQYAFSFDARFCSGCKACQAACKDKNSLPPGVLLRKVIEVTGGTWLQNGGAWENTVFAYNLSIACNHCIHPKCAGICPTNAYTVREDGIVILDTSKCMGCGYCSWACPYGAPQYNPVAGHMTKCDFCFDQLEQGLPPICVAACPMRVLDYKEITNESTSNEIRLWDVPSGTHPYPLPGYSHTQPRLSIKPHAAMATPEEKFLANVEEIRPRVPSKWEDVPLIIFSLLGQMAVGGFWATLWLFPSSWASTRQGASLPGLLPLLLIGVAFGAGALASFAHLGTKKNAIYVFRNLRRSWLSREVLFTLLFGIGWLVTLLQHVIWQRSTLEWIGITATLGLGLVYSMAKVYRLPSIPAWNNWRTNAVFIVSTLLLGQSAVTVLRVYGSSVAGIQTSSSQWMTVSITALFLSQLLILYKQRLSHPWDNIRISLILIGTGLTVLSIFFVKEMFGMSVLIFLTVLFEEAVGRWSFYQSSHEPFSPGLASR